MLVIPGEQMLDLMVRIGIALRETADCGGSLPPQGSRKLKLAADPLCPAITIGQGQPATRSRAPEAAMEASLRSLASAVAARSAKRQRTSRWSGECPELHRPSCVKPFQRRDRGGRLCCTNPVRDSSREASVVAGIHEQTDTVDLQDPELASV